MFALVSSTSNKQLSCQIFFPIFQLDAKWHGKKVGVSAHYRRTLCDHAHMMSPGPVRILIVDDDPDIRDTARLLLKQHFASVQTLSDPTRLAALVRENAFDVLLLDMNFTPGADDGAEGLRFLSEVLSIDPLAVVVLVTAHSDVDIAVEAMKRGGADFVTKPWENERLLATLSAASALRQSRLEAAELRQLNRGLVAATHSESGLIGTSSTMLRVFGAIRRAAPTDADVLILGENGTGKELVAREIHRLSNRASEVFLRVDLGTLSPQIFESELFGHRRGAFTDAKQDRVGLLRAATGGTLFLDEIGNVPLHLQAKLLTAIERREVVPVGTERSEPIDVRLICATNLLPERLADENVFRQDLRYRINTLEILLPPLRERPDDIPLLMQHYIVMYAQKYNLLVKRFGDALIERLKAYAWPGNVRELRHAVERAVILSEGELLTVADFPFLEPIRETFQNTRTEVSRLDTLERASIVDALERYKNNISHAAGALGLTRRSLYRRMKKHGL
jgi:two-component system response regulator HydG